MWWISCLCTYLAYQIAVIHACGEISPEEFSHSFSLVYHSATNKTRASNAYNPQRNSFLVYMMNLAYNQTSKKQKNCTTKTLCAISKYHTLVCEYFCNHRLEIRNDSSSRYKQIPQLQCILENVASKTNNVQLMEFVVEDMTFCPVFVIPYWTTTNREICETFCKSSSLIFEHMSGCCIVAFYLHVIFDVCLSLYICTVNSFILMFHYKTTHLQSICGRFVVSLAVADLTVGTVIVPFVVFTFSKKYTSPVGKPYQTNLFGANVIGFLTALSLAASLLTLLCSAAFRYVAVAKPEIYSSQRNHFKRLAKQCIICCWLVASAIGFGPIVLPFDEYYVHAMGMTLSRKMDKLFLYQGILLSSLIVLWGISGATYLAFKRKQSAVINNCTAITGKRYESPYRRREKSVAKVLTFIFLAFTICCLPLIITQSFSTLKSISLYQYPEDFDSTTNMVWNICMFFASRFVCLNSAVNGMVLFFNHRKFRCFVKSFKVIGHQR